MATEPTADDPEPAPDQHHDPEPAAERDHDPSPGPSPLAAVEGIETTVPDGEEPAGRCERCGRPFRSERALALHRGEVHDDLDAVEAGAYEAAREEERDELFFFHIRVVALLGVLWALGVVLYMVALGSNIF